MGLVQNLFNRLFNGTPVSNQNVLLASGTLGNIFTADRKLGAGSTLSLLSASHTNLTMSGASISATGALLAGASQTAIVRESLGDLALEYAVIFNVPGIAAPNKKLFGMNLGSPNYYEGARQVNNLILQGRTFAYNGGALGGQGVFNPLDIGSDGTLLRINPLSPNGYSTIVAMPFPYKKNCRLRIEGPADSEFRMVPSGPNVSVTTRYPSSGYIADNGSQKVKYAGNKYFDVDFVWTGDPTDTMRDKCVTYLEVFGIGPNGYKNASVSEVNIGTDMLVSKDFWNKDFVEDCKNWHTLRWLDAGFTNVEWYPDSPLTSTNRAKPEWILQPCNPVAATLTLGTGKSKLAFFLQTQYAQWGNGKLFSEYGAHPYTPFGAKGNDLRVQVVQGTGSSCTWAVDFPNKLITITLASGGSTAAQVVAAANLYTDADVNLFINSIQAGEGNDASGLVATTAPVNFSGGQDAPAKGLYSIERMIELHNLTDTHCHFTFPGSSSVEYATFIGNYAALNLKPGLRFIAEYANEVWNYDFAISRWCIARTKGLNTLGFGSSGSIQHLTAASYYELSYPIVNACKDAWVAAGRAAADCERAFAWQHVFRPGAEFILGDPTRAAKYDSYLSAPYNAGRLNGQGALGGPNAPFSWAGNVTTFPGQVTFYNNEAYAAKTTFVTQIANTPDVDTANWDLATAATVAPAFRAEQKDAIRWSIESKALAESVGLAYHSYEFGWHTLLRTQGPDRSPRLIHDISTSQAGYDLFANYVAEFTLRFPTMRLMHLGQYSAAIDHNFGLSEYLGQPKEVASRYRAALEFQGGTLPAYVSTPTWSISPPVIHNEGDTDATTYSWTVTLDRDLSTAPIPFTWAVTGNGSSPADGTDFGGTLPSGSGTFGPTETTKTITVTVSGDTAYETNENFLLTVSSLKVSPPLTSVGTINNDDAPPGTPVVRMRYARLVVEESANNRTFVVTAREMTFNNGLGNPISGGMWTGPDDTRNHNKFFALPTLSNGDLSDYYSSPGIYEIGTLYYTFTLPAEANVTSFSFYTAHTTSALGKWRLYVSESPLSPTGTDGTLVIDLNEPDDANWTGKTVRTFSITP